MQLNAKSRPLPGCPKAKCPTPSWLRFALPDSSRDNPNIMTLVVNREMDDLRSIGPHQIDLGNRRPESVSAC